MDKPQRVLNILVKATKITTMTLGSIMLLLILLIAIVTFVVYVDDSIFGQNDKEVKETFASYLETHSTRPYGDWTYRVDALNDQIDVYIILGRFYSTEDKMLYNFIKIYTDCYRFDPEYNRCNIYFRQGDPPVEHAQ